MSLPKKIAFNTFIAFGARIIDVILALVLVGILTRYLGKEGYGYYTTIVAYVHTFIALANLGLYNVLLRDLGQKKVNENEIVSNIFTLRILGLILVSPIGILTAFLFPYPYIVRLGIAIVTLAAFFLSAYQVLVPVFQKYLKIIYVSLAELITRIIYLTLVAFALIKFNQGLIPIIWAMVIADFIGFLLVFRFAGRFVKVRLRFDKKKWLYIIKESFPIGASIIFTLIYFRIDTIMLSLMKSASDVGIYGLAYKILENLIFFPAMFMGFIVPILTRYLSVNFPQFKKIFQKTSDILFLGAVPLVGGLIMTAMPIIKILGGTGFEASAKTLQFLAIAIGFIFFGSLYGQAIIILKKQLWGVWIYAGGALFNILTNLYFIPRYSYLGAALTTVMTEIFITFMLFKITKNALRWQPSFKISLKVVLATLPMMAFLYYFSGFNLLILITGSLLIYGSLIYILGGLTKKDLQEFLKKT